MDGWMEKASSLALVFDTVRRRRLRSDGIDDRRRARRSCSGEDEERSEERESVRVCTYVVVPLPLECVLLGGFPPKPPEKERLRESFSSHQSS